MKHTQTQAHTHHLLLGVCSEGKGQSLEPGAVCEGLIKPMGSGTEVKQGDEVMQSFKVSARWNVYGSKSNAPGGKAHAAVGGPCMMTA